MTVLIDYLRRNRSARTYEPGQIRPGGSTADGGVVDYRLGKLAAMVSIHGRWLDCGCCDGEYTVGLVQRGAGSAVGVDVDPQRVQAAAERWAGCGGTKFRVTQQESLPFQDDQFQGALLNEVLEHVTDEARTLAELRRVLAPGGVLAVFSPNRWFPFEGHGMTIFSRNVGVPVPLLPWLPRRLALPHMKARNYWPRELRRIVVTAGFEILHEDFAFPLFGHYPWLPRRTIAAYRVARPRLERMPMLRRFGVSTLIIARRPMCSPNQPAV